MVSVSGADGRSTSRDCGGRSVAKTVTLLHPISDYPVALALTSVA